LSAPPYLLAKKKKKKKKKQIENPKSWIVCHSSWAEQVLKADGTRTVPSGRLLA
jgi:hypothetical protein